MSQAETQQRSDAQALLQIATQEREQYIKLYTRLQSNLTLFVDRSNHELAALALAIQQKEQNIQTLQKMVEGYMVAPAPPVSAEGQTFKGTTEGGDKPQSNGVHGVMAAASSQERE